MKLDTRARLNLADPRQHRFAMARLKANGKTPASSPYLYERIEARRQEQLSIGLAPGTLAEVLEIQSASTRSEQHHIEGASFNQLSSAAAVADLPVNLQATASSTIPGGSWYTWLDVSVTSVAGQEIAPFAYAEEWEPLPWRLAGARVLASTNGNPSLSSTKRYAVSSYKYEDSEQGFLDSYAYNEVGKRSALGVAATPLFVASVATAPLEAPASMDGIFWVCLQAFGVDCDYIAPYPFKLPFSGWVTLQPPYVFDASEISKIAGKLHSNTPTPYEGELKLVLANDGGGCGLLGTGLHPKMEYFWRSVSISADGRTLSWNLPAPFDASCRLIQSYAVLAMTIKVPVRNPVTNDFVDISFTVNSDPLFQDPDIRLAPMMFFR